MSLDKATQNDAGDFTIRAEEFASAWRRGARPFLEEYLEGIKDRERREALLAMVGVDLEQRWSIHTRGASSSQHSISHGALPPLPRLEDYVSQYPELGGPEELPLDLIEREYRARVSAGDAPLFEHYAARFPSRSEELRRLFAAREKAKAAAGDKGDEDATDVHHGDPTPALRFAEHDAPRAGLRIGGYELIEEIARGGMGVVFRARQVRLNRIVALKMILAGEFASQGDIDRFHAEAEAAANLLHSGIVQIYEVGEVNGRHYFSMELVEGRNLDDVVRGELVSNREAAQYAQQIADAIGYAHQNGVLHRDIKPSNVLLDGKNQVKITDFGLAKRLEDDSNRTATGQVIGTPSYMPPEQARGDQANICRASDVYGVGALLYALLTGRPPFRGDSVGATIMQVIKDEPISPRLLNPDVDRDLETICLKCLQKEPGRRYESADELSEELGRYLRGEAIKARPIGPLGRMWRWGKRNPTVAGLLALVAISLLLGAAVSLSFAAAARYEADQAAKSAQEAHEEKERANSLMLIADREAAEAHRLRNVADKNAEDAETQRMLATETAKQAQLQAHEIQRQKQRADQKAEEAMQALQLAEEKTAAERRARATIEAALNSSMTSLLRNNDPDFMVRLTADDEDLQIVEGQEINLAVRSEQDGYLTLLAAGKNGEFQTIFPRDGESNFIRASETFRYPNGVSGARLVATPPYGNELLKAIITKEKNADPLDGFSPESQMLPGAKSIVIETRLRDPTSWAEHHVRVWTRPKELPLALEPRRVGLFVGVDKYRDQGTDPLPAAARDAKLAAQAFQEAFDLEAVIVLTGEEATLANIDEAIVRKLSAMTQPGDEVIIYWSGRGGGMRDEHAEERDGADEFLLTYDVNFYSRAGGARQGLATDDRFLRWLQDLDLRKVLLIVDASFGDAEGPAKGSRFAGKPRSEAADDLQDGFADDVARLLALGQPNLTLIQAARGGQNAQVHGHESVSLFTETLVRRLRERKEGEAMEAILRDAAKQTEERAAALKLGEQTPVIVNQGEAPQPRKPTVAE